MSERIKMPDGNIKAGSEFFVDKKHTLELAWNSFYHHLRCSCGWSSYPDREPREKFHFYWGDAPTKEMVRVAIQKHLKDKVKHSNL